MTTSRPLKQDNLEYAVLKHVADVVAGRMAEIKSDHLTRLQESADADDARQWVVALDGEKVATITLSQRAAAPRIIDESALIDAIATEHPDWLEHTVTVKDWAKKQILDSIADVTDDGAVTRDGEILPGITMSEPGEPYQSLRWAKEKGDSRGDELGRRILNDAIRAGDLAEILAGTGLPMIGDAE